MVSVFLSLLVVKENNNACSYENINLFEKLFRKLRRDFCSGFSVSAIGLPCPPSWAAGKIRQEYISMVGFRTIFRITDTVLENCYWVSESRKKLPEEGFI
jgi:hypothetical protein